MTSFVLNAGSAGELACKVNSMREEPTTSENALKSPVSAQIAVTQQGSNGIHQVDTSRQSDLNLNCISCRVAAGDPRVERNKPKNLTNSPTVWNEHGVYSSDGTKISFMSSYTYRSESGSNKLTSLKTEFMLMDSDGSHLQQITHFNVPGYAESQTKRTVAATLRNDSRSGKMVTQ